MNTPTQLEQLIYSMLTTSTGIAMMDSGGDEGRHWQRNQKRTIQDFMNDPEVSYDLVWSAKHTVCGEDIFLASYEAFKEINENVMKEIWEKQGTYCYKCKKYAPPPELGKPFLVLDSITISLFHFLTKTLDLDETCEKFNSLRCEDWNSDEAYGISAQQEKWLKKQGLLFGESQNSYNGECLLSQTIQYTPLTFEDTSDMYSMAYVLLQIHGGADVRGGYTDAKLFKLDADEVFFFHNDVCGEVDGREVTSEYNGASLTYEDNNEDVSVIKDPDSIILGI